MSASSPRTNAHKEVDAYFAKLRQDSRSVNEEKLVAAMLDVASEVNRATKEHGGFNSAHEAWGVLMEEVEEFWAEVKKKRKLRSKERMRAELIQIAAVAVKYAVTLQ